MSVDLDPPEQLEFNRPFTQQVARYLKVRNPHEWPVAYKVKTTAPRSYCVRPNSGRVEPGEQIEVQVLLQAMKGDPPMDVKCKDKFLLQSTIIRDAGPDANLADLWAQIEQEVTDGNLPKDAIQQRKIRCVWGPPLESNTDDSSAPLISVDTPTKANGVNHDEVPAQKTPGAQFSTPSQVIPPAPPSSNYTIPRTAPQTAPSTSTNPSLESQLVEAKAQIAALTRQLENSSASGLRQRTANGSSAPSSSSDRPSSSARDVVQNVSEQGVPIKIVAYLCLAAFLLAYLFF